jgi:hypothetical protein
LAVALHQKANVPLGKCGIEELKRFQSALTNYQVHVVSKAHFNAIVYQGPEEAVPIYIYNNDDHFDVITSMTGFLNRNFFCQKCKKGYQTKERHACNNPCHFCRKLHDDEYEDWQYCETCNCKLINEICFDLHCKKTEKGNSTCDLYYRCTDCTQLINRAKHKKDHVCGERYCNTCKDYVTDDHLCYMQPAEEHDNVPDENKSTRERETKYIFSISNVHRTNILNVKKVIFKVLTIHVLTVKSHGVDLLNIWQIYVSLTKFVALACNMMSPRPLNVQVADPMNGCLLVQILLTRSVSGYLLLRIRVPQFFAIIAKGMIVIQS